jgi:Fe-S cluster assembly protein SufD
LEKLLNSKMEATLTKKDAFLSNLVAGSTPEAIDALLQLNSFEFPTRKTEEWKYTRVAKLVNSKLSFNNEVLDHTPFKIAGLDSYQVIVSNGTIVSCADIPQGATISTQENANTPSKLKAEDIFTAINEGYQHGNLYIHVNKNVVLDKPIEITHVVDGNNTIAQCKIIIVAEQGSEAHIIETYYSTEQGMAFTNAVSEIYVKENAKLHIDKLQYESEDHWHINAEYVHQENNSNFTINTITLNGGTVRNTLNIKVDGENCETNLNGLYILTNNQHVDNHTVVDHLKPNCTSSELYKGMIDDSATGVFNGKVYVREDAQKIEAFQQNNNIIMTDRATMNSKPELEIYADDVKCSHGSTTGQFDEEAVFYLRARGIGEKTARKLLVAAFAEDVLSHINNEAVRQQINGLLKERFGWEN